MYTKQILVTEKSNSDIQSAMLQAKPDFTDICLQVWGYYLNYGWYSEDSVQPLTSEVIVNAVITYALVLMLIK